MSAGPDEQNWGHHLPEIPKSTGVFWPSIMVGALCIVVGVYLIFVPLPSRDDTRDALPTPSTTVAAATPHAGGVEGSKVLRLCFVDSKDSTFALAVEEFAKQVEEQSGGELQIDLLPGGLVEGKKLGERNLVDKVREGTLEMALSTTSPLTSFNHQLDVFDLPFLFKSAEHVDQVLDGQVGERLLGSLRDKNLEGLGYLEVGFRIFSTSIPLPDYASFKGKKLRVMQSVTHSRFVKGVGADPVPAPVDKIYLMGKEGYIDGADRTYPTYWDFQLYDVHRFITETRHAYSVKMILINHATFTALAPEHQEILRAAAVKASRLQRKKQREADQAVKELAKKEGIKIFELSSDERRKFVEASDELYNEYRQNQSREILDAIENLPGANT